MLRVAHCIASLAPGSGGTARVVRDLTDALSLSKSVSSVVLLSQGQVSARMLPTRADSTVRQRFGYCQKSLLLKAGWPLKVLLKSTIADDRPQLLHDHGIWMPSNHYVAAAARRYGLPLVINPHGMLEPWAMEHHGWRKRFALGLYQRADLESATLIFATADQEADSIRSLGFRQPIAIVPNGVEMDLLESVVTSKIKVNENDVRTVLFLSRIHPKKGLINLIEAWGRLRPLNWRLCLAGPDEGGHLADVMRLVKNLHLESVIQYVGSVEGKEKSKLFSSADLFVLPTFSENFGVVVVEALAHGVPVITTRGAPWSGLVSRECGWWIDLTIDSLTEALRQALSMNPVVLREMGERGRKYARDFDWPTIAEKTAEVYRWVLGQGPLPGCVRLG